MFDPAMTEQTNGLFEEKERRVFQYAAGGRKLWADPLTIGRRLAHALGGDVNAALSRAHDADESVRFEADEEVLRATRFAFDLPFDPATGEGATEEEIRAAIAAYGEFLQKKSQSGGTWQPSWESSRDPSLSPELTTPS